MTTGNLKLTKVGLPNTCTKCGTELSDTAYAECDDFARAGSIFCPECAGVKKKATRSKKPAD